MKEFIVKLIATIASLLILAIPFMWCWNDVIPKLFGTIELTYGQASSILVMIYIVSTIWNLKEFPKE